MPNEEPQRVERNIDLRQLMEISNVAARRVSAFLKISMSISTDAVPDSFAIGDELQFHFWPNPLPPSVKGEALEAFRQWIAGNCLRELDQHLAIFLDRVWWTAEAADLHGKRVKAGYQFDTAFERMTNAASKLRLVGQRLGVDVWSDCFASLSVARNVLAHSLGRVRKIDADSNNVLRVFWKAADLTIIDGEERVRINDPSTLPYVTKNDSQIVLQIVDRSFEFAVNDRINFTEQQLCEICLCYHQQAGVIVQALERYGRGKGIPINVA